MKEMMARFHDEPFDGTDDQIRLLLQRRPSVIHFTKGVHKVLHHKANLTSWRLKRYSNRAKGYDRLLVLLFIFSTGNPIGFFFLKPASDESRLNSGDTVVGLL